MLSGVFRRTVPRAAPSTTPLWSSLEEIAKAGGHQEMVELTRFKQEVNEVEAKHRQYSKQPEPIDWGYWKGVFEKIPAIEKIEQQYTSEKMTDPSLEALDPKERLAEFKKSVAENDQYDDDFKSLAASLDEAPANYEQFMMDNLQMFKKAADEAEEAKKNAADLEDRLQYLKDHRTDRYTTIADVHAKYPEIAEEIDDEIANHDWFKDTGSD